MGRGDRNPYVAARSLASLALWLLVPGGAHADPPAAPVSPPVAAPQSAVSGAAVAGHAMPQPDKALPQVTIEAQRVSLEHRLTMFVSSITRSAPREEALQRWQTPICPLVAGLSREQGEFMLERLSQIAREVGAPLDREHCHANLVVVVTSEPDKLIKAWGDRGRVFWGERASVAAFNAFLETPRPVRVWYNREFGSPAGAPATRGLNMTLDRPFTDGVFTRSKMDVKDMLLLASIAVIVDRKEVDGLLQIGQLTDYVAMVTLTETDLDAPLGNAPTILHLFDARHPGEQRPAGLSAWDQAFLKALYNDASSQQILITERSQITGKMLHDLAP